MNILIHAREVPLSDQLRSHAETRIRRLDRHFDRILDAHMEIASATNRPLEKELVSELRLHLGTGALVKGRTRGRDLRLVLDAVVEKVDQQLRRRKERLRDEHHALPASKVERG